MGKSCTEVEKDVCITHMDKTCTMSTLNVCRKVAVREFTPVVDTVERTGLKASIKAKVAAHKAQKKGQLPEYAARLPENKDLGPLRLIPGVHSPLPPPADDEFQYSIDDLLRRRRRASQSLKGDKGHITAKSADFKGRLETFKAGFKAAKAQYHEAKAQFKATTKALIHAKFNKGPKARKGDKGLKGHHVKAAVPTIRVRYENRARTNPVRLAHRPLGKSATK